MNPTNFINPFSSVGVYKRNDAVTINAYTTSITTNDNSFEKYYNQFIKLIWNRKDRSRQ